VRGESVAPIVCLCVCVSVCLVRVCVCVWPAGWLGVAYFVMTFFGAGICGGFYFVMT
jgi:hypothetical protein